MEDHWADGISVHPWLPFPLGPALKNDFPEIAAVSRWRPDDMVVRYKDKAHTETEFPDRRPGLFRNVLVSVSSKEPLPRPSPTRTPSSSATPWPGNISATKTPRESPQPQRPGRPRRLRGRSHPGRIRISSSISSSRSGPIPCSTSTWPTYEADWKGFNYQFYLLLKEGSSADRLERKISGLPEAPHSRPGTKSSGSSRSAGSTSTIPTARTGDALRPRFFPHRRLHPVSSPASTS